MINLKGMTWDHSRGYDPMIATSKAFANKYNNNVSIEWDKRPLQAFADRPIEQMVEEYDLMVIDYPHVGEVSAKGLLQNFNVDEHLDKLESLKKESVGSSHQSYNIDGYQWALAIDAASQVSCFREDLISKIPLSWNELDNLANDNKVLWPLKPVHAISSFYSIYNNLGKEFDPSNRNFVERKFGIKTLEMMKQIASKLIKECFTMDPIKTAELLSETDDFVYSPYVYGFSNYSRSGFRKNILTYGDVINLSNKGPAGTHLGGTGIAISKKSEHKDLALEYSYWIAGSECQKNLFYSSGGQPGNIDAWNDDSINLETNNFFKNTKQTLNLAWVRPRHNGYIKFQDKSGDIINEFLQSNTKESFVIDKLTTLYRESFDK
jgi:multiple sugar transport system substrate-binding protein